VKQLACGLVQKIEGFKDTICLGCLLKYLGPMGVWADPKQRDRVIEIDKLPRVIHAMV
jgi:hypothetical protein